MSGTDFILIYIAISLFSALLLLMGANRNWFANMDSVARDSGVVITIFWPVGLILLLAACIVHVLVESFIYLNSIEIKFGGKK